MEFSSLKAAIQREDAAEVGRLLDDHPQLLDVNLWPITIFEAKSLPMTSLLLERGLDPNRCSAPRKPLHLAATQKLPGLVALLLAHGADPNLRDGEGFMPLDLYGDLIALPRDDADRNIIAQLLAAGARPNLWTWIRLGETERALALLLESPGLVHAESPDLGVLPIHVAARMANAALIRHLIASGADVNAGENTALWYVAQSGIEPASARIEIMRLLLEAGAEINRRCEEGSTALHYAAWRGPVAVAGFLLGRGASFTIRDDYGKTPLQDAQNSQVSTDKEAIVAALRAETR